MTFIYPATTRRHPPSSPARTPPWWTQPSLALRPQYGLPAFKQLSEVIS